MTNEQRRQIVNDAKARGYEGSYVDLFRQSATDPQQVVRHGTQASMDGLRPAHQAGNTESSMAFTDVPPNTPFNTVGMKKPIDIKKYDKQGHLVKSYESVPPGIQSLDTGPNTGTVLETPARMQEGDFKEKAGLSEEAYEAKYKKAVDKYGEDAALAFDPVTEEFRVGQQVLPTAEVSTEADRDSSGKLVFKSDMAKDRYYANKNLGEEGGRQMQSMQGAVQEGRNKFAKNYLAPVAGGMLGFQALPYLAVAGEATYGTLAPTLGSTMSAPIAGVQGLTGSNLMTAGFASDFLVNRAPKIPGQIGEGQYMAAAENIGFGALDMMGIKGASGLKAAKTTATGATNAQRSSMTSAADELRRSFKNKIQLPIMRRMPKYKQKRKEAEQAVIKGQDFAERYYSNPRTREHLKEIAEELSPVKSGKFNGVPVVPLQGQTSEGVIQAERVLNDAKNIQSEYRQGFANKLQESGMSRDKANKLANQITSDPAGTVNDAAMQRGYLINNLGFTDKEVDLASQIGQDMPFVRNTQILEAADYLRPNPLQINRPAPKTLEEELMHLADRGSSAKKTQISSIDSQGVYYGGTQQAYVDEMFALKAKPREITQTAAHEIGHHAHKDLNFGITSRNRRVHQKMSEAVDPSVRQYTTRGKYTPAGESYEGYIAGASELQSRALEMRETIENLVRAPLKSQEAGVHAVQVGDWDALSLDQQRKLTRNLLKTNAGSTLDDYAIKAEQNGLEVGSNEYIDYLTSRYRHLLRYAPATTGAAAVGAAQMQGDEPESGLRLGGVKDRRKSRVPYSNSRYRK